jgi:hypothetical protein
MNPARVRKLAQRASAALIILQFATASIDAIKAPDASQRHAKLAEDQGAAYQSIYQFSPEKNVLIIVLDGFQGDVFQEIIDESPQYRKRFDGFTYYRDALGGYPVT